MTFAMSLSFVWWQIDMHVTTFVLLCVMCDNLPQFYAYHWPTLSSSVLNIPFSMLIT